MAQQTNPAINRPFDNLVEATTIMDRIEWDIQDNAQGNGIDSNMLERMKQGMVTAWNDICAIDANIKSQDREDYVAPCLRSGLAHLAKKHQRLSTRVSTLVPNNAPTVSHSQFQQRANVPNLQAPVTSSTYGSQSVAPSLATKKVVSFTISPANSTPVETAAAPSPSVILNRISYFLRNNNEAQALQEFNSLPAEIQKIVYLGMWIVRGRPMPGNPIAHDNFGEVSFKNQEQRCQSTPQQKACAVELIKIQAALIEMKLLLEKNDNQGLRALFATLPSEVQNQIMGKHWEVCGKPTPQSKEESLRNISHDNFGRVSFLGEDLRCEVPVNKKIETVQACLADYEKKFGLAQTLTEQTLTAWTAIDIRPGPGGQKNNDKRASLLPLAKAIVPLFMGNSIPVQEPKFNGTNYKGLAAEYIKAYPCLLPYFLQLVNDLNLGGALQASQTTGTQDTPKSSTPKDPNLSAMTDHQRKQYRTAIMQETYDTLKNSYYINSKGEKITLLLRPSLNSLKCATHGRGAGLRPGPYQTKIFLDKRDCLTVARELTERGLNPIVLDAASNSHFGGGYKSGAGAQEEYLCRASGLCVAVDPTLKGQEKDFYPLDKNGPYAGLYVAHVPVFRGEEREGYPYLDKPFETAVAIIAAPNFNEEHQRKNGVQNPLVIPEGGNIPEPQLTEMVEKCRNVLQMAQDTGHDSVVLVALGCGAFRNPPKHVCEILGSLITQDFPNSFKEVRISVIDDHNTGMAHNPKGNYQAFKETLQRLNVRFVES